MQKCLRPADGAEVAAFMLVVGTVAVGGVEVDGTEVDEWVFISARRLVLTMGIPHTPTMEHLTMDRPIFIRQRPFFILLCSLRR
ncbi:MAG: hypothetical protein ABIR84_11770 [Candidatus Nitrotoga sp.]